MECGESGKNGVTVVCPVEMAQEQDTENVIHQCMVEMIVKDHQMSQRAATSILVLVCLTKVLSSRNLIMKRSTFCVDNMSFLVKLTWLENYHLHE